MFNILLQSHSGSWAILVILFLITYFTRQKITLIFAAPLLPHHDRDRRGDARTASLSASLRIKRNSRHRADRCHGNDGGPQTQRQPYGGDVDRSHHPARARFAFGL